MATREEHQHSSESPFLLDDPTGTPLLYRKDTPALTLESILERSRQRCPPGTSTRLLDSVRRAAKTGGGLLSATARAIQHRAGNPGLRLRAAVRSGSHVPAAYRRLQAELQHPRSRSVRLTAGAASLVLLLVLAVAVAMAPTSRRTSAEIQSPQSAGIPSLPTVAPGSRLADRSIARTPKPQNPSSPGPTRVGTSGKRSDAPPATGSLARPGAGAVAAARAKPSSVYNDSPRRAGLHGLVGSLLVNSEPSGAEVLINGVSHGRTPLRVSALPVGSSVVRLELPGYERWSWAVNVAANKRTPLRVKLQPDSRRRIPGS
jgi:hypothetical protein